MAKNNKPANKPAAAPVIGASENGKPPLDEIMAAVRACLSIIAPSVTNDQDLTQAFKNAAAANAANPGSPNLIGDFLDCLRSKYKAGWWLAPSELLDTSAFATDTVRKIARRIQSVY